MRKDPGHMISRVRKPELFFGFIMFLLLPLLISWQDSIDEQPPSPPGKAISEVQISVLITKKSWAKVSECGFYAVVPLIKSLNDSDVEIRAGAAEVLGDIGDKRAVEPLIESLRDKERQVRQQAARALGKIGSARAVEPLTACLKDPSRDVRLATVEALKNIADAWAFKSLLKTLNDSDSSVRKEAVKALLVTGGKRAVEPFLEYLKDPGSKSKVEVIRALGVLGDKRAVETMISMLKDGDPAIRMWSVEVLRKIGDERAVEPLSKLADDPDAEIRLRAAEALKKLQISLKPAKEDKPVEAEIQKPVQVAEAPSKPFPDDVSIPADFSPAIKTKDTAAGDKKEIDTTGLQTIPVEAVKGRSSLWIYALTGGAAAIVLMLVLAGFCAGMKKREDIIMDLDNMILQIRDISRNATNEPRTDADLNLLKVHAEALVQLAIDTGSREKKKEHLCALEDSLARLSETLGSRHHAIVLLRKKMKLVMTAIDKGIFDNHPDSDTREEEKNGRSSSAACAGEIETGKFLEHVNENPVPVKNGRSGGQCMKCRCCLVPAGPAEDEPAERALLEQSKPPPGIMALKKREGKGEGLLLEYLKKRGFGLFCRKCSTARCHSCLKPGNPSKCEKCGGDMVIYRKE